LELAIELSEDEAKSYEEETHSKYMGLAQGFWMYTEPIHSKEVFSLMRESNKKKDEYLDCFFDTGFEWEKKF
jgi:hypothetical protein